MLDKDSLEKEISFRTSRSGGKGGQNVNKVESRIELIFDVNNSECLSKEQKNMIFQKLKSKLDNKGALRIVSQSERSQYLNKQSAKEKFFELLNQTLKKEKPRLKTKPDKTSITKRLESKKKKSLKKTLRSSKAINCDY